MNKFGGEMTNILSITSIENILPIFMSAGALFISGLGLFWGRSQWKKSDQIHKTEITTEFLNKLRSDAEIVSAFHKIEYQEHWYGPEFHCNNEDLERKIDFLFSTIDNICYMKSKKLFLNKDFQAFQYIINRVCSNPDSQTYLWNLYHFSKSQGVHCSFGYLIEYGIKEHLFLETFESSTSKQYEKVLNF